MKLINPQGQAIYYNVVAKDGLTRYIIKTASGQSIAGRDRQPLKSRTFKQEPQAEAWIRRNGYTAN